MGKEGTMEEVIEAAVRAQVATMVTASLEGIDGLTAKLVAGALQAPVKDGDRYSSKEISFIEKLARDTIREATQEAMKTWVEENRGLLEAEVARQLSAQRKGIATTLVNSLAEGADKAYRFRVSIDKVEA